MKKALARKSISKKAAGSSPEYRFDYAKSRPNRFASRMKGNSIAVVLDPDVASVFNSSKAVNAMLRSVMSAMPDSSASGTKSR